MPKDFLLRERIYDSAHFEGIRTRNSNGSSSIAVRDKDGKTIAAFHSGDFGDEYEQVALEFAGLLEEVANDPCRLPKVPKEK